MLYPHYTRYSVGRTPNLNAAWAKVVNVYDVKWEGLGFLTRLV